MDLFMTMQNAKQICLPLTIRTPMLTGCIAIAADLRSARGCRQSPETCVLTLIATGGPPMRGAARPCER